MRPAFILQILLISFFYSCDLQEKRDGKHTNAIYKNDSIGVSIDSIYFNLSGGRNINYKKITGQFTYLEGDTSTGRYLTIFGSKEINETIKYISYGDNRKDTIIFDNAVFGIEAKVDPSSIEVYTFLVRDKKNLVFIGKAQSASGSGVQITYFILMALNKKGEAIDHYEFNSRFGDINSLVDYNKDGALDYFKIINGKKGGEYILTVNEVQSKKQINEGSILLEYKLKDEFVIIADMLSDNR